MALYKYDQYVTKTTDGAFDRDYSPGSEAPLSGIYKCLACGREAACNHPDPLPPQNHHQHTVSQGAIRWRLAVWANHNPS